MLNALKNPHGQFIYFINPFGMLSNACAKESYKVAYSHACAKDHYTVISSYIQRV